MVHKLSPEGIKKLRSRSIVQLILYGIAISVIIWILRIPATLSVGGVSSGTNAGAFLIPVFLIALIAKIYDANGFREYTQIIP